MLSCAERLLELARQKPRYGYRRLHVLLQRQGQGGEREASLSAVSAKKD